jgi:hypothetical protein
LWGLSELTFNLTQASEKISFLFAATLAVELAGLSCAILERPTRMRLRHFDLSQMLDPAEDEAVDHQISVLAS